MGLKSWLSNLGTSDYDRYEAEDERALNEEIMRAAKAEEERQHKQREAERQALLDALRYEYQNDRDGILLAIKDEINENNPDAGMELINKYASVADRDEEFKVLADRVGQMQNELRELSVLKTKYEFAPIKDYETRIHLLRRIVELEPSPEYQIELLKLEYSVTPEDNYNRRVQLLRQLIELEPSPEYSKTLKNCEKQLKTEQSKLARQNKSNQDYRIGRMVSASLCGAFYSSDNVPIFVNGDKIVVRCHTHGISISNTISSGYSIHYSNIVSLENIQKKKGGVLSTFAGAAVGFVLGGILGAVAGGLAGGSSDSLLKIVFTQYPSRERAEICIAVEGDKADEQIKTFIHRYYYEIEVTKRTKRSPQGAMSAFVKFTIAAIVVISIMCVAIALVFSRDDSVQSVPEPALLAQDSREPAEEQKPVPMPNDITWNNINTSQCTIRKTGTVLTVSGKSAADASVEISGVETDSCKTVSVIFDKNSPKTIKCSMIGQNSIKLSTDQKFIKRMRDSNKMTVNIPLEGGVKEQYEYSLNGFSKACSWAK